ncbi:MAG: DNA-processing protein DprA [Bacteroides sp.]|nr:DNA-processing protein DprA [Bacteroides sp.]MCM1379394.1 DNA-processing protein DprA [Bacteroides sp.]MCM1445254.1 DNA-processing protein DprA [Prevotella sp.]
MQYTKLQYQIAFSSIRGMNVTLGRELLRIVGSEREFFALSETRLRYLTQSKARIYSDEYRARVLSESVVESAFIESHSVRPLYFTEPGYPRRMLECEDAPLMLYACGNLDLNDCRLVGIVGTRHATPYGLDFVRKFVGDLASKVSNLVIVSGLAYGIDIAAHRASLKANVPTVGVMATGLQTVYPSEHRSDAQTMVSSGGMLVTEYGHLTPIHKGNFVARNRIVAGICDCIVVVESAEKGGALITANLAVGYNRDVFAVPGRISDQYSAGCNRLIAGSMAMLIRDAEDLCRAMHWPMLEARPEEAPALPMELNSDESQIVSFLEHNPDSSLSQLTAATGFGVSKLMSILIDLEFRSVVMALPGGRYQLA